MRSGTSGSMRLDTGVGPKSEQHRRKVISREPSPFCKPPKAQKLVPMLVMVSSL